MMKMSMNIDAPIQTLNTTTGYVIAPLTFFINASAFSRYTASRLRITSRIPPASPASIMFTKRSEKHDCLRSASASVAPASTSYMTSLTIFLNAGLSIWLERMSRHWTIGRPALIIVANCRVNTPRSRVVMRLPRPKLSLISFGFSRIVVMMILRLRRVLMSSCLFSEASSPESISPVGVLPFHI